MPRSESKTVLIADDDRDLVNLLSVRCRRMGLKVLTAYDAFTALALVKSKLPDCVCLDVQMPSGSGLGVCEMIAADEQCSKIPIVMLTGRSDPDTIARCHALCAYYVEKCPSIWTRLEPLLIDLLDRTDPNDAPSEQANAVASCERSLTAQPGRTKEPTAENPPILPVAMKEVTACDIDAAAATRKNEAAEGVWRHLTHVVSRVMTRNAEPIGADAQGEGAGTERAEASANRTSEPKTFQDTSDEAEVSVPTDEHGGRRIDSGHDQVQPLGEPLELQQPETQQPKELSESIGTESGDAGMKTKELDEVWRALAASRPSAPQLSRENVVNRCNDQGTEEQTILIADDDSDLVQMLVLRCSQLGLRVFRSPDAMHALLGVHRIRPNLLLIDVNMPGGNGISVCEMLASDQTLRTIPVIVMTGETDPALQKRAESLGAKFLRKGPGLWERVEPLIRVALNLTPTKVLPSAGAAEPAVEPIPKRPAILCIDDDPELSRVLKMRLEPYGIDLLRAFNGMQGYWTALDMRPQLILMDMVMPDGGGNYILGRLRSHPLTAKIPVLMLTGVNTPGVRRQMFSLGVDGFLTKPVDFGALLDHIRQYVTIAEADRSPLAPQAPQPAGCTVG